MITVTQQGIDCFYHGYAMSVTARIIPVNNHYCPYIAPLQGGILNFTDEASKTMRGKFLNALAMLLAALLLSNFLSGCGQKGDLYLPDQTKQSENKRN